MNEYRPQLRKKLRDSYVQAIKETKIPTHEQLKLPYKRATFDTERFKTENPAMYADYLTTETKEKFDITKFKKEHKKEASEYMLPPAYDPTKTVEIKEISIKQISVYDERRKKGGILQIPPFSNEIWLIK